MGLDVGRSVGRAVGADVGASDVGLVVGADVGVSELQVRAKQRHVPSESVTVWSKSSVPKWISQVLSHSRYSNPVQVGSPGSPVQRSSHAARFATTIAA